MGTKRLPGALTIAAVTLLLGNVAPAGAAAKPRDPHAHPNGPHQTLPPLPGEKAAAVRVNPVPATVPLAPPTPPVLPAPIVVPTRPPEPPPPPVVAAAAEGAAERLPDGLRVTFGRDSAALNPATDAALQALASRLRAEAQATVTIAAYAAGTPDDPSAARRLSLSRALAVRSVLLHAGLPSPRIYVRALGASVAPPPGVTPDRVDLALAAPPPQASQTQPSQTQSSPSQSPATGQTAPAQKAAP